MPEQDLEELAGGAGAGVGAEAGAGAVPGEEALPPEPAPEEAGAEEAGAQMATLDIDQLPGLAGLQAGDPVTLIVRNVSDDGRSFEVEFSAEAAPEEAGAGPEAGKEAVAQELIGPLGQ